MTNKLTRSARSAPLVVVGCGQTRMLSSGNFVPSHDDPNLSDVAASLSGVRVENVLKRCLLNEKTIEVYYFGFARRHQRPKALEFRLAGIPANSFGCAWTTAHFEWLVTDGTSCTIFALESSGSHPGYKVDTQKAPRLTLSPISF